MFVNMLSTALNSLIFGYILDSENGNAVGYLGIVLESIVGVTFILFTIAEIFENKQVQQGVKGTKKEDSEIEDFTTEQNDTFLVSEKTNFD